MNINMHRKGSENINESPGGDFIENEMGMSFIENSLHVNEGVEAQPSLINQGNHEPKRLSLNNIQGNENNKSKMFKLNLNPAKMPSSENKMRMINTERDNEMFRRGSENLYEHDMTPLQISQNEEELPQSFDKKNALLIKQKKPKNSSQTRQFKPMTMRQNSQ